MQRRSIRYDMRVKEKAILPTVKWESRKYRDKTPRHAAVKKVVRATIHEFWQRIPESARLILSIFGVDKRPVILFNTSVAEAADVPWHDGLKEGRYDGLIYLNMDEFKHTRRHRDRLLWIVAHEYAHAFWDCVASCGCRGLSSRSKYSRKFSKAEESALLTVLKMPQMVELEKKNKRHRGLFNRIDERLTDAVAIAWGFGREYALQWQGNPNDFWDTEDNSPGYLDSEIGVIHSVLAEREQKGEI